MVDIETNPLYYAAVGGIILGIATSLHYVLKGNVTGMSGILYDVSFLNRSEMPNKITIIGGILIASGIFFDIFGYGTFNHFTPFGPENLISEHTSYLGFALAGLLVGFGTKLGNGCTSGHGLCGLPRLSIRSFVAVGVFLTTAIGIATLKYYCTLGPFSERLSPEVQYVHLISANLGIFLGVSFFLIGFVIQKLYNKQKEETTVILRDLLISLAVGLIFGSGLIVAGMARRRNILQFLWMGKDWNPSLLFVLGCGVLVNLVTFNYMIRVRKVPVFGTKLFNPDNTKIDWKLLLGAASFGLGWGIGGLCPGPFFALFSVFQVQIHVIWVAAAILGMFIANKVIEYSQIKNKVEQQKKQQKIVITPNNQLIQPKQKDGIKQQQNKKESSQEKVNVQGNQQSSTIKLNYLNVDGNMEPENKKSQNKSQRYPLQIVYLDGNNQDHIK